MKTLIRKYWVFIFLFSVLFLAMPFLFTFERKMFWDITLINLPWRYHLSESINNRVLPLWNPYINNGFPQMGHYETWYPVSWVIALLFKYDLQVLQYEYLLHLFIAGIGFYKLSSLYSNLTRTTRITGAIAYMLCGLFISQASHLGYIISGAWMTFVFYYLIKFLNDLDWNNGLNLVVFYLLLISGGYPGNSVIITYICLLILCYYLINNLKQKKYINLKKFSKRFLALVLIFAVVISIVAFSVFDLQSQITRQNLEYSNTGFGAITGSNSFQSYISLISPSSTAVKHEFWLTSPMLNNSYIGILFFILPIFYTIYGKKEKYYKQSLCLFIIGLFFLLTSVAIQFPLHKLLYNIVPLLNRFRFPSIYRIFFILSMVLISLQGINLIISEKKHRLRFVTWLTIILTATIPCIFYFETISILDLLTDYDNSIKSYSINEMAFIDSILLTLILVSLIFILKFGKKNTALALLIIVSFDIIVHAWIITPKFVSTNQNPQLVDTEIEQIPDGFPLINTNLKIKDYHLNFKNSPSLWLNKHSYNKYPCILGSSPYATNSYGQSIKNKDYNKLIEYPFLPIFNSIINNQIDTLQYNLSLTKSVKNIYSSPNEFNFAINNAKNKFALFNHNKYKYWIFYENGIQIKPITVNTNYYAVQLKSSKSILKIRFEPQTTIFLFYISSFGFLLLIILSIITNIKCYLKNKGN